MIESSGPPYAQGAQQGQADRARIRAELAELRRAHGVLGWIAALERAHRGAGRRWQRFLPQQHERLCGIARAVGFSKRALELREATFALQAQATHNAACLEVRFVVSPSKRNTLGLRRTEPEAVGFASVELIPPFGVGCLAGVSAAGIAIAVLADRSGTSEVPVRVLAQDTLYRAADFAGALEHLRLRASYAGGTGQVALLAATGEAARIELQRGRWARCPFPTSQRPARSDVILDPTRAALSFLPDGAHAERACARTGG